MKIVYISSSNPMSSIGGAANTASNWIDTLLERDVEIDIICRGDNSGRKFFQKSAPPWGGFCLNLLRPTV
jgi:hypothetical protein